MYKFPFVALVFLAVIPVQAGKVTYDTPVVQTWDNLDCTKSDSCTLTQFALKTQGWKADYTDIYGAGAYNWGDTATFSYKTSDLKSLEDYVFVQFVQGCVFDSWIENGIEKKEVRYQRLSFGQNVDWENKGWMIDSDDLDPVYNSPLTSDYEKMSHPSRQGLYRWNSIANSEDRATEFYFGFQHPPTNNRLYAFDRPGSAFTSNNAAKNISLEFKMCIYKSKDVPMLVKDAKDINFAQPLSCLNWSSSHIYDWNSQKYHNPKGLDVFCTVKN